MNDRDTSGFSNCIMCPHLGEVKGKNGFRIVNGAVLEVGIWNK